MISAGAERARKQTEREKLFCQQVALGHLASATASLREAQELLAAVGDPRRRTVSGAYLGANEAKQNLLEQLARESA